MAKVNLGMLFWFYKKPRVCKNRLELIKKYNPNLKIFGLYGGNPTEVATYKSALGKYLDDLYISPFKSPDWKWINGDLMILDWYTKRGKNLPWESIVVIQWDTLVFDSLLSQFSGIKKGEVFFSGYRELDQFIESRWYWTRVKDGERKNYLAFLEYARRCYDFHERPVCCLFILQVFPRIFFKKYSTVKNREIGMLEYKVPIYAKIFKIPIYQKDFGVWWYDRKRNTAMNALPVEIKKEFVEKQLKKKSGWRIFHPYYKTWKLS